MPEIQQLLLELPEGVEKTQIPLATHSLAALAAKNRSKNPQAVLCVPGFTGSKEDYVAILPPLNQTGFKVFSIDQRGQYESKFPVTKGSFSLAQLAQDVVEVSKAISQPIHLIGHSMGGLVAAKAIQTNPELFSSLTMLCSGPGAIPPQRQKNISAIREGFPQTPLELAWEIIETEEKRLDPNKFTDAVWEFRKKRWMQHNPQALHEMAAILQDTPDFSQDLAKVLSQNQIAALVLTGENDDVWPLSEQQQLAKTINAKYTVLKAAGHSPARETPGETAAALMEFFDAIVEKRIQ